MDLTATPATTEPTDHDRQRVNQAVGALLLVLADVTDPLHRLDLSTELLRVAEFEQRQAARESRAANVPWTLIAEAARLNSKQAAQARWGR